MKNFLTLFILLLVTTSVSAQVSLHYYLPDGISYNNKIPTPKEILGAEVGEWHVRHDQLVNYMYAVAEVSDRITISEYGRTYENRPLLMLTITSPDNQKNIDEIKRKHLQLTDAEKSDEPDIEKMPVVVSLNYSVHGNEPSGTNAAMVVVYHLAAAQGKEIERLLENTIIILDPSVNPDGMNRFANWANVHRSLNTLVTDPQNREFNEVWPGGRGNHYWFDLNRDWLLVQHPESKERVARFHEWKPNVLTDHHEMGTNSTFFFQPGIPSRTHPLTPSRNQALTAAIAEYHTDGLDKIQSLYYSQENFDDYYYGKGSTYPDINGSIGILFEQASSRGHAQESENGILTFPFTIRNQVMVSLSTLKAAQDMRFDLLEHMKEFYKESAKEAGASIIKAYVFGESSDKARTNALAKLLIQHKIKVYTLNSDFEYEGNTFESGKAYIVPTNQQQYKLITAVFERRTTFTDSLFYDVSAWTLPYAFNLPFVELRGRAYRENLLGKEFDGKDKPRGQIVGGTTNYGYLFGWDEYFAPRAAYRLLSEGVRVKVASGKFTSVVADGTKEFNYGSLFVPLGIQDDEEKVLEILKTIAKEDGITVYAVETGLTPKGIDLGSSNFVNLKEPKVAIIGGRGTNAAEVGEIWHLLDQRYHIPLSILESEKLNRADLDRYNVLVMAGYNYSSLAINAAENIKEWVQNGGTLIAFKQAVLWAKQTGLADVEWVKDEEDTSKKAETRPYIMQRNDSGAQIIGGAIFNTKIDLTHPLCYGFNDENLTVFRNSAIFMKQGENPYSSPVIYTDAPLAAGYSSKENLNKLKNSAAVVVSGLGRGKVIAMTDDPNFRAFWYGTNKLFANAIFFGQIISRNTTN